MNDSQYRRVATNSGSAVIVFGLVYFFFATDAASGLSFGLKTFAASTLIIAALICLRLYFRPTKKK